MDDKPFEIGEHVHYKYYGEGVIIARLQTEQGWKYLIMFKHVSAWMYANHLLTRIVEEEKCPTH